MKQIKRKRAHALFERIEIELGNVKIISNGQPNQTQIFIDGILQTNVEVLRFTIDARATRPAKLYLEIVP